MVVSPARGRPLNEDMQIGQRATNILNAESFDGTDEEASQYLVGFVMSYTSQSA